VLHDGRTFVLFALATFSGTLVPSTPIPKEGTHIMGTNPRNNGHDLTRLTISGGNKVQPRLLMAHPTKMHRLKEALLWRASPAHNNPPVWQLLAAAIAVIVIILLVAVAGRS
jgi:hypothetical protein